MKSGGTASTDNIDPGHFSTLVYTASRDIDISPL